MFIVPTIAILAIDNFVFTLAGTASDVGFLDFFALNGSDIIDGATFQCTGGCSLVENIVGTAASARAAPSRGLGKKFGGR